MVTLNPYLTFSGNCKEAFDFYKSVFGGDFTLMMKFSELPADIDWHLEEADKERIMHISLPIKDDCVLMGSDVPGAMGKTVSGTNFSISITTDSEEETKKLFDALSDGGVVTMPLEKTFWNAYFGTCKDKFGIQWMVSYDYPQEE